MKRELLLPLGTMIAGFILCGFGSTTTLKHPVTTICIVAGLVFSATGFIALILVVKKNRQGSGGKDK
jgi:hypothetical protein